MPAIVKIIGFELKESSFSAPGKRFQMNEVVSVKMDSHCSPAALVALLPVAGAPGTTTFNPQQLTFTFGQSRHPDNALLYLDDVGQIKYDGLIYKVPLIYRQPPLTVWKQDRERRDQVMQTPEVDDPETNLPIINPTTKPCIYTRSSRTVERETYFKADGTTLIRHTNGIPIRQPVKVPMTEIIHSFTWNRAWADYDPAELTALEGKVSNDDVDRGLLQVEVGKLKCESISMTEEYETPNQSTVVFHYARLSMTLIESPYGFEHRIPSMSTRQRKAVGVDEYVPIIINARGDKATEPWPLDADGIALPWADVIAGDLAAMAFLDIDFPETADINAFMATHNLSIKTA